MIGCTLCSFKSGTAFSTNLKMHLRTHHKEKFIEVTQLEAAQKHLRRSVSTPHYENAGRMCSMENTSELRPVNDADLKFVENSDESTYLLRTNLCDLLYFQLYEAAKRSGHLAAIKCPEFEVSHTTYAGHIAKQSFYFSSSALL